MDGYHSPIDQVPMPKLTAETLDDNGADNLRLAIVKAAADNYVDLVKGYLKHPISEQTLDEYLYHEDRFFHSRWFKTLTMDRISGDWMIKALRAKAEEEINDEKRIKSLRGGLRSADGDGGCYLHRVD